MPITFRFGLRFLVSFVDFRIYNFFSFFSLLIHNSILCIEKSIWYYSAKRDISSIEIAMQFVCTQCALSNAYYPIMASIITHTVRFAALRAFRINKFYCGAGNRDLFCRLPIAIKIRFQCVYLISLKIHKVIVKIPSESIIDSFRIPVSLSRCITQIALLFVNKCHFISPLTCLPRQFQPMYTFIVCWESTMRAITTTAPHRTAPQQWQEHFLCVFFFFTI